MELKPCPFCGGEIDERGGRCNYEKQGIPVRRELAKSFLWFTGDGEQNHFREVY